MKHVYALVLSFCFLFCCGCAASPAQTEKHALTEKVSAETGVPIQETAAPETVSPTEEPAEEPAFYEPDFRFTTTDREGNVWDESVFAGHALTMINFWEPWCGYCVYEMPDLQKLYEAYEEKGLLILGVYSTPGMEEDVDAVLKYTGVSYPILNTCEGFSIFKTGYVPTTVFVDREGHVVTNAEGNMLYAGSRSYSGWAAVVEGML